MIEGLVMDDGEDLREDLDEDPRLDFREYAIAFHLAAEWRGEGRPERAQSHAERALESYEDDMLLYAHRDEAPFRTRIVRPPFDEVAVRFAPALTYEAEGRRKRLRCPGAGEEGRTRRFRVALAETVFERSETRLEQRPLAVLSLVLLPSSDGEQSALDEYDVIKLVKLWEGGESVSPETLFAVARGEEKTLHELAASAFDCWRPLAYSEEDVVTTARGSYRVGTAELELPLSMEGSQELFADVAKLKDTREAPEPGARWDRVVALGGILQGLLDFRTIDEDELADVFADVDVDPGDGTILAFHKGTLLSVWAEAEAAAGDGKRPSPLGSDPYLAVPNIVLLHSEQRLKSARLLERNVSEAQRGPLREFLGRVAINTTENALTEITRLLAQDLPNVFHYSKERRLQKRGRESRGLDDLGTFIHGRVDDLSSVLQSRVRRRDRWTATLGIAVGVVTAFLVQQAIQGRPLWLVALGAVGLFGVFLWLRDKLF